MRIDVVVQKYIRLGNNAPCYVGWEVGYDDQKLMATSEPSLLEILRNQAAERLLNVEAVERMPVVAVVSLPSDAGGLLLVGDKVS